MFSALLVWWQRFLGRFFPDPGDRFTFLLIWLVIAPLMMMLILVGRME